MNEHVVVTGASTGIGRAIAVAFGRAGWNVSIGSRRAERLAETAAEVQATGAAVCAHELDVRDAASVDVFFAAAEARFGVARAVVANAGMANPGAVHEIAPDALQVEVETNLLGAIFTGRRAVSALLGARTTGDVVFITSDATRNARPKMATYTATKAGIESFAQSLGMELEGTGIRSIAVRVGPTITEFGAGWDMEQIGELMPFWQHFGLQRHDGYLAAEHVADAVLAAVTMPAGVHVAVIEVQPEAPTS